MFAGFVTAVSLYVWEWFHWLGDKEPSSPGLKILFGSSAYMPVMERTISDTHWDSKIEKKPFTTPKDVLEHLKECEYRVGHMPDR